MANVAQPPLFYLASFPPLGPDTQQPSSILALPFSLFKWFSFYFPFLAIKFVMHHLGFPFRCTFCLSHVPQKGKKHIMENASNICWHNCCLSVSPPLSHFLSLSLPWLLSPHTFPRRICFVIRSIDEFTILWGVFQADSLLTAAFLKSYAMFAKENHKNTKRSWSDISQGEFTKNIGQCSGANFALFYFFCQYNSISGLTVFVFIFSANYARSWTWPCNCCSLSYQFSRVSCFFSSVFLLISSVSGNARNSLLFPFTI